MRCETNALYTINIKKCICLDCYNSPYIYTYKYIHNADINKIHSTTHLDIASEHTCTG